MKNRVAISSIFPLWIKNPARNLIETRAWVLRSFGAPSPSFVKRRVLLRNGIKNATWVETGTYRGETALRLSKHATSVYTIEPSAKYFEVASKRLKKIGNVSVVHGSSEERLPEILAEISGNVNFWLDGHFSGGETYQGSEDTPVVIELESIAGYLPALDAVVVIIDDLRYFGSGSSNHMGYPSKEFLIDWAVKLDMSWHIEHDMFIAATSV